LIPARALRTADREAADKQAKTIRQVTVEKRSPYLPLLMMYLYLNYIFLHNPEDIYTVPIQVNANVDVLRQKIKGISQLLSKVKPEDIQLFAVSLPFDKVQRLQRVTDPTQIPGARELSDLQEKISVAFPDPPLFTVHVIAIAPPPFLNLNFYIAGQGPEGPVEVYTHENISFLKYKVKQCQPQRFSGVDEEDIRLFAVSLPLDQVLGVTKPAGLEIATELTDPKEEIWAVCKNSREDHVHVVVF